MSIEIEKGRVFVNGKETVDQYLWICFWIMLKICMN
jgi:hypothetical protein